MWQKASRYALCPDLRGHFVEGSSRTLCGKKQDPAQPNLGRCQQMATSTNFSEIHALYTPSNPTIHQTQKLPSPPRKRRTHPSHPAHPPYIPAASVTPRGTPWPWPVETPWPAAAQPAPPMWRPASRARQRSCRCLQHSFQEIKQLRKVVKEK